MTRCYRVLRWLTVYESRKLLNLFLLAVVLFTAFLTYTMYYNVILHRHETSPMLAKPAGVSLLFIVFLMWVGATFAFSTLFRRHAGRQLLLLPASNAEKFLALWLLYVPLLFVLLSLAFIAGDLLRMAILPLLTQHGSQPSVVPLFFSTLWKWMTMQEVAINAHEFMLQSWAIIIAIHTLCLLSSVVAGYVGWLLSGLTVYGCAYLFIESYGHAPWHVTLLLLLALLVLLLSYRLFCRFPLFNTLYSLRFHDI